MSPCKTICKLDKTGVYCVACFRLMSEIEDWPKMDDTQKAFVVAASLGYSSNTEYISGNASSYFS